MKIRNILLTGDDGYNSIGTRLLIHYLKNEYQLNIAGTKIQQSGVGGMINVTKHIKWKEIEVDGIKGVCVDGTPSDTVEVANSYFNRSFDLIISGINLGANIGGSFFTSGTIAAALRAIMLKLSLRGITISQHILNPQHWFRTHNSAEDISSYLEYPGKTAYEVIRKSIQSDLWGSTFVNINLPAVKSNIIKFTKPLPDLGKFYDYPGKIDRVKMTYIYPMNIQKVTFGSEYDAGALQEGYISITPANASLLHDEAYLRLKDQTIILEYTP